MKLYQVSTSHGKQTLFPRDFNSSLHPGDIPLTTFLDFNHAFNQPLEVGVIPCNVEHLTFSYCFNQPLKTGVIPEGVKTIQFGYHFNQPLGSGVIPSSTTAVWFGLNFNRDLVYLPETLHFISLPDNFNSKIKFPLELRTVIGDFKILYLFEKDKRILLHKEKKALHQLKMGEYVSFIVKLL